MSGTKIGIDLGTTNSAVACVDGNGLPRMVRTENGSTVVPSTVYFSETEIEVGQIAKNAALAEPENVAQFFKREMGNPHYNAQFAGKEYSAQDLSQIVLGYLKKYSEEQLGQLGEAIVTVPAYFNNSQREATLNAARAAGLNANRTINEPTAAATAYGEAHSDLNGTFMVYDLGGGTFDVTIVEYSKDRTSVLSSEGNHELGGVLWDDRLINIVASEFESQFGVNPLDDPFAYADLRIKAEDAKKALSARDSVSIPVSIRGNRSSIQVTRERFIRETEDLLDQTRVLCRKALDGAGILWPKIDAVLLVGGSTRMQSVRSLLQQLSRKDPLSDINPDECVAVGAALSHDRSSYLSLGQSQSRPTIDVTPHSLGYVAVSHDGKKFINDQILKKNVPIPNYASHEAVLKTTVGEPFEMDIFLLQGESTRVLDNHVLGHYVATGPSSGKEVNLNIEFKYNVSGIVEVGCKNRDTDASYQTTLQDTQVDLSWTDGSPTEYFAKSEISAVLLIDTSSSMSGQALQEAIVAGKNFLESCPKRLPVGLMGFGGSGAHLFCNITEDHNQVQKALSSMSASGGTPMAEGIIGATAHLKGTKGKQLLVVLTDGAPDSESAALSAAQILKDSGATINAIGTTGADQEFLKRLASDPAKGILVKNGDVSGAFDRIARALKTQSSGLVGFKQ